MASQRAIEIWNDANIFKLDASLETEYNGVMLSTKLVKCPYSKGFNCAWYFWFKNS